VFPVQDSHQSLKVKREQLISEVEIEFFERHQGWQFSFQGSNHLLQVQHGQFVSEVERKLSERVGEEVEVDRTQLAVTPDTVLHQSDFTLPVIALDSQFRRIRVRRENSSTEEFHQFLEFTTVSELKIALCPDDSPKKVQLFCNKTLLLDDFQPLSDILIQEPHIFDIHTSPSDRDRPTLTSHRQKSFSRQSVPSNENEWIFHFEAEEEDSTFRFDSESTVGDVQSILSNARSIFCPPFALYANGIELCNQEELLQSIPHEITIRRSISPSSEFHIIFPNGCWQSITRRPISDLRHEIGQEIGEDIALISRGQFVFDDHDIGDDRFFVCIRRND
jgi:hypothetical protein